MRLIVLGAMALVGCSAGSPPSNAAENAAVAPAEAGNQAAAANATANAAEPAPAGLSGTQAERVAQLLVNIVGVSGSRDWDAARNAFPGARWDERTSDTRQTVVMNGQRVPTTQSVTGATDVLLGSIELAGTSFDIIINGSRERVQLISLSAPGGTVVDRAALRRAVAARGATWRRTGCMGMDVTVVELTANGHTALLSDTVNSGSRVEPSSDYSFSFGEPEYVAADLSQDCQD